MIKPLVSNLPNSPDRDLDTTWGLVNPYLRQCDAGGGKCHCHAVIFVGGDNGSAFGRAAFILPQQDAVPLERTA